MDIMDIVELDGAYNVRDLGGLRIENNGKTRHGLVYRGDSLDFISNRDESILFGQLGIRAVIDLRTKAEADSLSSEQRLVAHHSVAYHRYSLLHEDRLGHEPFPADDPVELAKVYLNNAKDGKESIRKTFETLYSYSSSNTPCIFHCAAGRDRTGIISAILLALVNVSDSDIATDYLRSNHHAREVTQRLEANPLYSDTKSEHSILLLKKETILMFLDHLRAEYGGAKEFLLDCGISPAVLQGLRNDLTCSSS
jgi:protein-tyrosine phosphatase